MNPKFVIAPNALKGSLSAQEAARAIALGVRRAAPDALVVELPIADGGDGTRQVLCDARRGATHELVVEDALGRPVTGAFSVIDGATGVVDVATASGLGRLSPRELDPMRASSFGTGQLLRAALDAGCERLVLGVGGSASADGGAGILEALGVRLLDDLGQQLPRGGGALARLASIDLGDLHPAARRARWSIACDVTNPLLGPGGAARVYGPQKGASASQVAELERSLERLALVLERNFGRDVRSLERGGAAGGIAAGLHAALGAELVSGIDLVLDALAFERAVEGARLVLTAEGRLDDQSAADKGPFGVARRAARAGVPTVVLAGAIAPAISDATLKCFADAFEIQRGATTTEEAMRGAAAGLAELAEDVARRALEPSSG